MQANVLKVIIFVKDFSNYRYLHYIFTKYHMLYIKLLNVIYNLNTMQEYLQNFDDFQFGIHDNCINILFYFFRGRNYIRNNSFVCF